MLMKEVTVLFILVLSMPLVFSISIRELVARYSFSAATQQMNITNYTDFMIDKNGNGINDLLVFELTSNNTAGTFVFAISLLDKNGILTNETNRSLSAGINKINLTFSSILLSQSQFNYSIKVYNESNSQKYRKDNILTQNYANYEEGFKVLGLNDSRMNKTLAINLTINSPENKVHVTTLFLTYKNSTIFSKGSKSFKSPTSNIAFNFDNETIKKTHFIGNFTVSSVKIGFKKLKADFSTKRYDFRDFATASYIYNFTDNAADTNENGKYDFLELSAKLGILNAGNHTIKLSIYDLFGNPIEIKNASSYFNAGSANFSIRINGSLINDKKLNGPYIVKNAEFYESSFLADKITDAYTTGSYNFNDFESGGLPDLAASISVSGDYHYGIENVSINFTFANIGAKPAFNADADIFDNISFYKNNRSNLISANSHVTYQLGFTNISDFEATAIADLQNNIEESNESNNAFKIVVKLNKKPYLSSVPNLTVNETAKILVNLSASDPNGDNLSYSINFSKFSRKSNIFEWNTSVSDSGDYLLKAAASDGYLNDTLLFRLVILDAPEKDTDNDGIEDDIDRLIGDKNAVNTTTINLSILIGDSANLSKLFSSRMTVAFREGNLAIAEFSFNFSKYRLNLANITMNKQSGNSAGSLLVKGLKIPEGTKTLYVDRLNTNINGVCIKESEISSLNEISNGCSSSDEFAIECDGTLQGPYACAYNSTTGKYKIEGLGHSGIVQFNYAKPATSGSSSSSSLAGSGGGGSGGFSCDSQWKCGNWSDCFEGLRSRKCEDKNQCAFSSRPEETEKCETGKFADVAKSDEITSSGKIRQSMRTGSLAGITGNAAQSLDAKLDTGIFIVFTEIIFIVGAYLSIRKFFKNI
jgi:hypothetical protein